MLLCSGASSASESVELVAVVDGPVDIVLDGAPLELVLSQLLADSGAELALEVQREILLDGRYEGPFSGLLSRVGAEHGLSFDERHVDGELFLGVRETGADEPIVADGQAATPTPTSSSAPPRVNAAPVRARTTDRTASTPPVIKRGDDDEPFQSVTDIPGFATF